MRPLPHRMSLPILRRVWLLVLLLAGLSGCGPASSGDAPSLEPRTSGAGPSESPTVSQHNPSTHHAPVTPVARPASAGQGEARPAATLVVPAWMANALDSPDVRVRLRALDTWAQQGPHAPLDPLLVALDDKDDKVREKAMAIIEQHWAVEWARQSSVEQEGEGEQGAVHHE